MERLVVQVAPGKFDVIEGRLLNDKPLSRAEADRLAHEPVKATATDPGCGANAPKSGANAPPKQAPKQPQPAPAVDLRATGWDQAGGSCGFRIKGGPTW